mgnify:CR=1 FL=1|jgi:uncharacterized membrane protein
MERIYMTRNEKTNRLVMTAMMICLVLVATFSIRIPSPFTQGYVHLGDTMVFLSVLLLGKKSGALAAGLGSGLADILGGYAAYAPWTLIIKALMAFIMGVFIEGCIKKEKHHIKIGSVPLVEIIGMVIAGIEMVIGYALVDGFLAGNLLTGFLGAPFNVAQFAVGLVLATLLAMALYKTPAKKYFAYRLDEIE